LGAIDSLNFDVEAVPDLCRLAARKDQKIKQWAKNENLKIVACYPRAITWLFHVAGTGLNKTNVEFLNMRIDSPEKIIESLTACESQSPVQKKIQLEKTQDWVPWFPVIDYDRCVNCKQCMNFCLFGVYALSPDDKVHVKNPANCKTNCPACARLCPQKAIIFPKYNDSPINGGEIGESVPGDDTINADLSRLINGNIHDLIRSRSKPDRTEQSDMASNISQLKQKLDIPTEVLASLSPENITQLNEKSKRDCPNSEFCQNDCENETEDNPRE
jgi:NAD-dependent dihydropyrimidine dehydrogenase PreA subunit